MLSVSKFSQCYTCVIPVLYLCYTCVIPVLYLCILLTKNISIIYSVLWNVISDFLI